MMIEQFRSGILDIDGLCLMIDKYNLKDCYVANSYLDCYILKEGIRVDRYTIIAKDYEPHFIVLHVIDKKLLIIDSSPYEPLNIAKKWKNLFNYETYINDDFLQYDDYTCKLFAFNNARRLQKMENDEIINFLRENRTTDINLIPLNRFPVKLLKDIQSYKFISEYNDKRLCKYVSLCKYKGENKYQNTSINHFLLKNYQKMRDINYDINISKYLGLELRNEIDFGSKIFIKIDDLCCIRIYYDNDIISSKEQIIDENRITIFLKKDRENIDLGLQSWYEVYKPYLKEYYKDLTKTWIKDLKYSVMDEYVEIYDGREKIINFIKSIRDKIITQPSICLDNGIWQLLTTYCMMGFIIKKIDI